MRRVDFHLMGGCEVGLGIVHRSLKKEQKLKKKKADAWKERKDLQRQSAKVKQKK